MRLGIGKLASKLLIGIALLASASAQEKPTTGDAIAKLYAEAKAAQSNNDNQTAIAKYEQILSLSPRLAPVYNNLGILYIAEHDLPKAAAILEQGLKIDPHMKSATALLGLTLFQMAEFDRAEHYLRSAIRNDPKDVNSRTLLAKDLMNLHRDDDATSELRSVVAIDAGNQEAWYLLGKAYLGSSIKAMQKAGEIDPDSVLSHEMAGEVMESLKNTDGALVEYRKAIQMAPTRPGLHLHLADLLSEMGNWESARKEYLAELNNDPNNCTARWMAAHSLLENEGASDSASGELNESIQQCSGLTGARIDRAKVLTSQKNFDAALEDLLFARKTSPDDPTVHFLLAQVYRAQNRKTEAVGELGIYRRLKEAARDAEANRAKDVEKARSDLK